MTAVRDRSIGVVSVTAAGQAAARHLAEVWPEALPYDGPPREALARAFAECGGVVCFLAVGATVRLLAPLLRDKHSEPGVVCVDEAGRFAVPVLGGHAGGANELAERVADVLGAQAVVTTASDAAGVTALDTLGADLGFRLEPGSDLAAVGVAMLRGQPVSLVSDRTEPLPPLPPNVVAVPLPDEPAALSGPLLAVTDRVGELPRPAVVYRPPSIVVGVGSSRGVSADEVRALVDEVLGDAGVSPLSVRHLATVEAKRHEPGIVAVAAERGWQLVCHPAEWLADIAVPHPSEVVRAAVGTPSVAEAAALAGGGELLVPKRATACATAAVARVRARGRLSLVGLGPGARDLLTPRARAELARASVVVGLDQYVDQIRDLLRPGTRVEVSGLGDEEARARQAVDEARAGHAVALVGSGDAGIYAMAAPALEFAGHDIDVVGVPGVTAALAAAAVLGAPLGHDHAAISLSDLHTPWPVIERRVRAAADGDFVVTFYNPRSRARRWQLPNALAILRTARPAATPVGVVRDASRPGQTVRMTNLGDFDVEDVDMVSVVVVGSTRSRVVAGRMVTPRDYRWEPDPDPEPEPAAAARDIGSQAGGTDAAGGAA